MFLTTNGLMQMSKQIVMVCLDDLVDPEHIYRRFSALWKFESIKKYLNDIEKDNNYPKMTNFLKSYSVAKNLEKLRTTHRTASQISSKQCW